jgi:RNA polymerase sigma factor (sigma-70 family)
LPMPTTLPTRDELILAHLPMVGRIARKISHMLAPHLDIRDLVGAGCIGLVEAANRYRPANGAFDHFAYFRIRGAIIDANRRQAYREELNDSIDAWAEAEIRSAAVGGQARLKTMLVRDARPLEDEMVGTAKLARVLRRAVDALPLDERLVLLAHLRGERMADTARERGRSLTWTRGKLTAAREDVTARLRGLPMPARRRTFVDRVA